MLVMIMIMVIMMMMTTRVYTPYLLPYTKSLAITLLLCLSCSLTQPLLLSMRSKPVALTLNLKLNYLKLISFFFLLYCTLLKTYLRHFKTQKK